MFDFILHCVLLFVLIFHGTQCQRRIKNGEVVTEQKRYVAYLLKASASPQLYSGWLCGGALVSTEYIVTSAACVTDVIHLYAVAGYNKYISDENIENDPCTKEKKKKIILTCTPKAYVLKYEELEKWSYIDIAVVKVESPYDFADESYANVCSYTPTSIEINYDPKFQEPGIDAIVFGWGHLDKWRTVGDLNDYNQAELHYAPTLIEEKDVCKKEYEIYTGMGDVIDRYMICTTEKGNINERGETILKSPPTAQGCNGNEKLRGYSEVSCETVNKPGEEIVLIDNARRNTETKETVLKKSRQKLVHPLKENNFNSNFVDSNMTQNDKLFRNTRRNGICQNDHGGPLVTWIGAHEVLIGVASVFKINEEFECIAPYLYASTQCNGAFLDCILNNPSRSAESRREICDSPPSVKGFDIIEQHISWRDHPDGPADNERHHPPTSNTNNTKTINQNITEQEKIEDLEILNTTYSENNLDIDNNKTTSLSITITTKSNNINVTTINIMNTTSKTLVDHNDKTATANITATRTYSNIYNTTINYIINTETNKLILDNYKTAIFRNINPTTKFPILDNTTKFNFFNNKTYHFTLGNNTIVTLINSTPTTTLSNVNSLSTVESINNKTFNNFRATTINNVTLTNKKISTTSNNSIIDNTIKDVVTTSTT